MRGKRAQKEVCAQKKHEPQHAEIILRALRFILHSFYHFFTPFFDVPYYFTTIVKKNQEGKRQFSRLSRRGGYSFPFSFKRFSQSAEKSGVFQLVLYPPKPCHAVFPRRIIMRGNDSVGRHGIRLGDIVVQLDIIHFQSSLQTAFAFSFMIKSYHLSGPKSIPKAEKDRQLYFFSKTP
jgi:hypothetical protein